MKRPLGAGHGTRREAFKILLELQKIIQVFKVSDGSGM
ncbi:hypothetical protein Rhal01_03840 [Rubritalea halochordaticola]|uniref:Uncharacterized protein n=1 Tax=Rubritalea halochordaticola TaxID=714537 RepID=A0ABP9V7W3_9BACT